MRNLMKEEIKKNLLEDVKEFWQGRGNYLAKFSLAEKEDCTGLYGETPEDIRDNFFEYLKDKNIPYKNIGCLIFLKIA